MVHPSNLHGILPPCLKQSPCRRAIWLQFGLLQEGLVRVRRIRFVGLDDVPLVLVQYLSRAEIRGNLIKCGAFDGMDVYDIMNSEMNGSVEQRDLGLDTGCGKVMEQINYDPNRKDGICRIFYNVCAQNQIMFSVLPTEMYP